MKTCIWKKALITAAALAVMAAATGSGHVLAADSDRADERSLRGRIVAVGIPGASAISAVGNFLPGGPIHDDPAFAEFTQPGRILDPVRILVGSRSNFGAPKANLDELEGSILSIDPIDATGTEILVIPPTSHRPMVRHQFWTGECSCSPPRVQPS